MVWKKTNIQKKRLTSTELREYSRNVRTEFSFDPCNSYRDCAKGVPREAEMCKKCVKMANFWNYRLNYWETVEDRWVHAAMRLQAYCPRCVPRGGQNVRAVLQALNPLSNSVTFTAIFPGT